MTSITNNGRRASFFDVDYTLIANNSVSLFVRFMRQEGKVGVWEIITSLYYLAQYKLNLLDFERIAGREVKKLAGEPERDMIALCDRWFKEMVVDYIYPEGERLVEQRRQAGDVLVLLSAASPYLVQPMADRLGIRHVLCNRLVVDAAGRFTGEAVRPLCYGKGKLYWAELLAAEQGLILADCAYYSDSITDLPVLERFGEPVAVNPDPLLRKEARKRGWTILDFKPVPKVKGKRKKA